MKNVWELFPELTEAVRKDHEGKPCGHHPFEHALMVAQYCLIIAEAEQIGELAAIAGLLHNTDRLYPNDVEFDIENRLHQHLRKGTHLFGNDQRVVIDAVLKHNQKNDVNDSSVLVCLKDADRLSNINPFDVIARAARMYPDLPLVHPMFVWDADPTSSYKNPKTILRDAVHSTLEWETWLRLPKAQNIAAKFFEGLMFVKVLTYKQLAETNLTNYPPVSKP